MNNPTDVIYYANLIATNSAGGVTAGAEVMNNFQPPNPNVNLGPANATTTITVPGATTSEVIAFNEYLVPGTTNVTLLRAGTTYVGKDWNKDGNILWTGGLASVATINYNTGAVTIGSTTTGDVINVTSLLDTTADTNGTNILKIRSAHVPLTLLSQPKQFIFEENEHANMYMARIMAQAAKAGGITDYRDLYFSRLTNMYIEDINRDLIKILVTLGSAMTPISLDLTPYTVSGSFADTKNDVIAKFFINCRSDLLARTGVGPTVVVTSTVGAALLESHPTKWVAGPNFYTQQNGFVGTFNSVPVYRHNYLDSIAVLGTADFYFGIKLPDNSSGTMVFGEFLPLVQTATIGNVANPLQKSTGWFSQVATQAVESQLVTWGRVTLGSY
jgi:hypothetical protein